jgi:hypothetical protein
MEWVRSKPNKKENPQFHEGQDGKSTIPQRPGWDKGKGRGEMKKTEEYGKAQ